jgi:hypothetical protein
MAERRAAAEEATHPHMLCAAASLRLYEVTDAGVVSPSIRSFPLVKVEEPTEADRRNATAVIRGTLALTPPGSCNARSVSSAMENPDQRRDFEARRSRLEIEYEKAILQMRYEPARLSSGDVVASEVDIRYWFEPCDGTALCAHVEITPPQVDQRPRS